MAWLSELKTISQKGRKLAMEICLHGSCYFLSITILIFPQSFSLFSPIPVRTVFVLGENGTFETKKPIPSIIIIVGRNLLKPQWFMTCPPTKKYVSPFWCKTYFHNSRENHLGARLKTPTAHYLQG